MFSLAQLAMSLEPLPAAPTQMMFNLSVDVSMRRLAP
jgi:hypothetical protein